MSSDLERLASAGLIRQVQVDLGPRRQALRQLYLAEELEPGIDNLSAIQAGSLLSEQTELGTFFGEFIGGRPIGNVIVDVNPPAGEGVRKFKTTSFRFWGWAPSGIALVLVRVVSKAALVNRSVRERDQGRLAREWMRKHNVAQVDTRPWYELFAL